MIIIATLSARRFGTPKTNVKQSDLYFTQFGTNTLTSCVMKAKCYLDLVSWLVIEIAIGTMSPQLEPDLHSRLNKTRRRKSSSFLGVISELNLAITDINVKESLQLRIKVQFIKSLQLIN